MLVDPSAKTQPLQTHRFTSLKRVEQRASTRTPRPPFNVDELTAGLDDETYLVTHP
jgi:hypothetical protein